MSTVISVENLGKKYTLHHKQRESYRALRDVLTDGVASIGQRLLHPFRRSSTVQQVQEEFWALKDISFEVKQGDRIGIIGRNGAGKSTLLKILSRITEPTTGKVKIKGRVASLLEVGTGFHPELTGRENIYLNGAILGMSRVEIKKKFDEIVDFAEIEKFLDTPVKRYSSGMYVRLAFAVAAHLEPEILVVDEVLAVGDAQFQKKCLGKMEDVGKKGRTVLFVSHNMGAVNQLCNRGITLRNGKITSDSFNIEKLTKSYLINDDNNEAYNTIWKNNQSISNKYFNPKSFGLYDHRKKIIEINVIPNNKNHYFFIEFSISSCLYDLRFGIVIYTEDGIPILTSEFTDIFNLKSFSFAVGLNIMMVKLPAHLLNEGLYIAEITASSPSTGWILQPGKDITPKINFEIKGGLSDSPCWTTKRIGFIAPILEWEKA